MPLPKCFIAVGKNQTLNVSQVDKESCYIDLKSGKAVVVDKHGNKFYIAKKVLKGKLEVEQTFSHMITVSSTSVPKTNSANCAAALIHEIL